MEVLISIIALVFTMLGLHFSEKSRLVKISDNIYTLLRQFHELRSEVIDSQDRVACNRHNRKLVDVQLQIKHLLIEANKIKFACLSLPQRRLLADTCEDLLYYKEAEKHWKKCLSKRFVSDDIKAEYYRRYAQFLYEINKEKEGCAAYRKALELKNDNDGSIYINVQTYRNWIGDIFCKIKMGGYKSYHSQEDSPDYYVPLVKGLLNEMNNLSGKIKDARKREKCYKQVEGCDKEYRDCLKHRSN